MYDVYLNERNDLLVVPRGSCIPIDLNRNWRKKRVVRSVSEQIREDVRIHGYHRRKLPLSRSVKALADTSA
ncbi:hypothetical protein ACVIWU_006218 [Bradyrhizobium sp. USDA 4509]|nr:hypothetical protein [Bradyrhizobium elkanii]ODM76487.1 hypothetical protein A6452_35130 [Bradyrhizobium elkanii]